MTRLLEMLLPAWRAADAPLRLGIAIGSDAVRGVAIRGGRIVWSLQIPYECSDGVATSDVVETLIRQAPRGGSRAVVAAVGPRWVQTRRLVDLPPVTDRRALASLVRENGERLFVNAASKEIVVSGATADLWAAAYDDVVLRAAVDGCHRAGRRLVAAVPAVSVLWPAFDGQMTGVLWWRDGAFGAEIRRNGDQWSVRRASAKAPAAPDALQLPQTSALRSLGEVAHSYADAFGAATARRDGPLAFHPVDMERQILSRRVRIALAATLWVMGGASWAAAPGIAAHAAVGDAKTVPDSAKAAVAERTERELAAAAADLAALRRFAQRRRVATTFLRDLTAALPDSTVLSTLELDADGGTLVARAPQGAAVPTQIEAMRDVGDAEVTGAIALAPADAPPAVRSARGTSMDTPLEQVSVRFRWRSAYGGTATRLARGHTP